MPLDLERLHFQRGYDADDPGNDALLVTDSMVGEKELPEYFKAIRVGINGYAVPDPVEIEVVFVGDLDEATNVIPFFAGAETIPIGIRRIVSINGAESVPAGVSILGYTR